MSMSDVLCTLLRIPKWLNPGLFSGKACYRPTVFLHSSETECENTRVRGTRNPGLYMYRHGSFKAGAQAQG